MLIMAHVRSGFGEFWGKIVSVTNQKELDLGQKLKNTLSEDCNADICHFRDQFVFI